MAGASERCGDAHFVVSCHDELGKVAGARHVTALSDVHEVGVGSDPEGFETLEGEAL